MIHPDQKRLLSLVEIRTLLGQNSADAIFEYNALVNAILKQWFEWLRGENNDVYIRPPCEAVLYNAKPKQVKKILMTNKQNVPTACHFRQKKFEFILKEEVWHTAWKTTKETRLRLECYNEKFYIIYIQ